MVAVKDDLLFAARPFPEPPTAMHHIQQAATENVFRLLEQGHDSQLVVMATGVGKTLWSVHTALRFANALFLVHFDELRKQSVKEFQHNAPGVTVGQIWDKYHDLEARIVVGMIPTLFNRLSSIDPKHFDVVIVDEAHHARSRTWETVVRYFRPILKLGLSATPDRSDGRSLTPLFGTRAFSYRLPEAIRDKLLLEPKVLEVSTNMPLRSLKRKGDDYDKNELARVVNTRERNLLVLKTVAEVARDRKGVGYTAGVTHAKDLADLFNANGLTANAVWGDDPERTRKMEGHRNNDFQFIFNDKMLIESYDDPTIECGMMLRPCLSRTLYEQALGRPARLLRPGKGSTWTGRPKEDFIWIDMMDTDEEERCRVWDFFGAKVPKQPRKGGPRRVSQPYTEEEIVEEAYNELPPQFQKNIPFERYLNWVTRLKEPPPFDLEHEARFWHRQPATPSQLALLEGSGYDCTNTNWTKGDASKVIGSLPPSTAQQARLLALGFDVLTLRWTRHQAETALDQAQQAGQDPNWNTVRGLAPHLLER